MSFACGPQCRLLVRPDGVAPKVWCCPGPCALVCFFPQRPSAFLVVSTMRRRNTWAAEPWSRRTSTTLCSLYSRFALPRADVCSTPSPPLLKVCFQVIGFVADMCTAVFGRRVVFFCTVVYIFIYFTFVRFFRSLDLLLCDHGTRDIVFVGQSVKSIMRNR